MSPEVALVFVVLCLWGPTALWLIYRSTRAKPDRPLFQGLQAERESTHKNAVDTLVVEGGYWVCGSCRSVNRPDSSRCYNCRAEAGAAPVAMAVDQVEAASAIPASIAQTGSGPANETFASDTPPSRWGPLRSASGPHSSSAKDRERAPDDHAKPADSTAAVTSGPEAAPASAAAPPRQGLIGSTGLWGAPQEPARRHAGTRPTTEVGPVGPPHPDVRLADGLTVCPYLGTRDDPATRFDFPYAGNACHAGVATNSGPARAGRLLQTFQRMTHQGPQPIALDHQATICLAAAHVQCPRFLQVTPTPTTQTVGSGPDAPVPPSVTTARRARPAASEAPSSAAVPPQSTAAPAKPRHFPAAKVAPTPAAPGTATVGPSSEAPAASRRRGADASAPLTTLTYPPKPVAASIVPVAEASEPTKSAPHAEAPTHGTARGQASRPGADGIGRAEPAAHVPKRAPTPSAARAASGTSKSSARDAAEPSARRRASASRAASDAAATGRTSRRPASTPAQTANSGAAAASSELPAATRSGLRTSNDKGRSPTSGGNLKQRSHNNRAAKAPAGAQSPEPRSVTHERSGPDPSEA